MKPLIFVVEDDSTIREVLASLLEMEGYDVREAANGQEALTHLQECRIAPCMILLDLMMPVMDGVEFRRRQLQDPNFAQVPVVVITGKADIKDAKDLGLSAIIEKPFKLGAILNLAAKYCRTEM